MRVCFASSAFAKRYLQEAGTADVLAWCDRADELALSVIAIAELISAFGRLRREGRLAAAHCRAIKCDLLADIEDALICETTAEIVRQAVTALEAHPLRGMDAVHIGAARACAANVFICADARQCQAAGELGFEVVVLGQSGPLGRLAGADSIPTRQVGGLVLTPDADTRPSSSGKPQSA